jgi:tetratricopeptide (TPR) repeat protein
LGDIHQAMSHMEEALKYFEDYNKAMKVLYESNPSNASFKSNLANSNFNLGNIHQLMGHTEESLKNFKEVIKSTKDLYELNPKDINLYATLGILYSKVASLYKSKNNKDESAKNFNLTGKIYHNCFQQTRIGKYDIWKNVCLSELDTICRNYISEADTLLQHSFSDKARVIYLKADSLYLKKNELSQNVDNIWNRGWIYERLSACAADYNEKLILLEKALELRLEVYRSYPNENTHPVVINTYGNLAWYYILSKKYSKSESATLTAIEIGQKNKIEESQYNWVYTNLAHSLLFQGKFEEAKKIYLEMKDKVYPQDTTKTFRYFFLKDFDDLKQAGITHPDVSKIRELLK